MQVICARPPGLRGRKTHDSDTVTDSTWFGGYGIRMKDNELCGDVLVRDKKPRRIATGLPGQDPDQDAAVQVARDTFALLLDRLHNVLGPVPMKPVHVLSLAFLENCKIKVPAIEDRHQTTLLMTAHLYTAVIARHRQKYVESGDGAPDRSKVAHVIGYCTARLACGLREASKPSPLPASVWETVRGAAVATMTAFESHGQALYAAGAKLYCGRANAAFPEEVLLTRHKAIFSGLVMAGIVGGGPNTAEALRDFVAGDAAPGTGVVPTRSYADDSVAHADDSVAMDAVRSDSRGCVGVACGGGTSDAVGSYAAGSSQAMLAGSGCGGLQAPWSDTTAITAVVDDPAIRVTGVADAPPVEKVKAKTEPVATPCLEGVITVSSDEEAPPTAEQGAPAAAPTAEPAGDAAQLAAVDLGAALQRLEPSPRSAHESLPNDQVPSLSDVEASQHHINIDTYKYDLTELAADVRAAIKAVTPAVCSGRAHVVVAVQVVAVGMCVHLVESGHLVLCSLLLCL